MSKYDLTNQANIVRLSDLPSQVGLVEQGLDLGYLPSTLSCVTV